MNTRITSLSAAFSLALAAGAFAQNTPPTTRPFDMMPNQWQVGLATNNGAPIWGANLAGLATPLAQSGTKLAFAFGQCYGGGMLTNLSAIAPVPNGPAINISATSASSWHQSAWYRAPINGVPVAPGLLGANTINDHSYDWVDSYVDHFSGAVPASAAADNAWAFDPFNTNTGPVNAAGRVDRGPVEQLRAREIAQYYNAGAGGTLVHQPPAQANKYAILYSGVPNAVDADQIGNAWNRLIADGYAAGNIQVLFGAGWNPANPNAIVGMLPLAARNQALQATENNLINAFAAVGNLGASDQLFFLANDHGTARNNAWPINRWVETPKPGDSSSSGSQLPYDLEGYTPGTDPSQYFGSYYVPAPGALSLGALGLLVIARRRR